MLNSFTNQLSKIKLPNNFDAFMKSEKQDQLAVVGIAGNQNSRHCDTDAEFYEVHFTLQAPLSLPLLSSSTPCTELTLLAELGRL